MNRFGILKFCPDYRCLLALLVGLSLSTLSAQVSEPADVSLDSWLTAALELDPDVSEARAEYDYQYSRSEYREVWEDPELRVGSESREERGDRKFIRLRVPVPNPWETNAQKKRAEARADVGMAELDAIAWERRMELSSLYFETVYAAQEAVLREDLLNGLDADLIDAERGASASMISIPRMIELRSERALIAARLSREVAEHEMQIEEIRVRAGWQENSIASLSTDLPKLEDLSEIPSLESLHTMAFRESGAMQALNAQEREGVALDKQARARTIPWITFLEGTWVRTSSQDRDDIEARIGISLPVFSLLRRNQTEEALRLVRTRDRVRAFSTALEAALQTGRHRAVVSAERLRSVYAGTEATLEEIDRSLATLSMDPRQRSDLRDLAYDLKKERLEAARDYQLAILDLLLVAGPDAYVIVNPL